ncbi:Oidioi.mRNA.OKI2018_I69.XSR.g16243.t1.cds [Oikopleura dioica]|uniref:Oidioi.mRNA.OKI2018_I69.XSR.g16243.t1.cds n=1 Tax=Oikopleura dioica TaxID=34765 RepID=A0ABN7SKD1_OIKDI|nr:Oidioi.mRNA.OKI2018_I69.XSR.g16243.t1.cds [Oikopleura dioica]
MAQQESAPGFIRFCFFILGMGTLLPWNFFITPFDFWMHKLKINYTETGVNGTEQDQTYQDFWQATMGLATMSTNFVMCFVTTLAMNRISRNSRFVVPLIGIAICFTIAAVYTKLDKPPGQFFAETMVNVIIITVFCAILQASLFGHGGEVGDVMPSIMGGQGVGGIAASVVDIFCKLVFKDDVVQAASLFFVIPAVFMVITVAIYLYMQRLPSYQERLAPKEEIVLKQEGEEEKEGLVKKEQEQLASSEPEATLFSVIMDLQNGVAKYMFCVFFAFVVTLGCFPAVVVTIKPANYVPDEDNPNLFYDKLFTTIVVFFLFNVADTIGRVSSEWITRPGKLQFIKPDQPNRLVLFSLSRIIFIILFVKCNVFVDAVGDTRSEPWFKSDIAFCLIMLLFGITNGMVSSIAMAYAPEVAPLKVREQVGGTMGTVLVAGLFGGACLAFPLTSFAKSI